MIKKKSCFFALIERKNKDKKSFWSASIDIKRIVVDFGMEIKINFKKDLTTRVVSWYYWITINDNDDDNADGIGNRDTMKRLNSNVSRLFEIF